MLKSHAYCFLAGLYIGGFTNFFSDLVITGLLLYIIKPEIYSIDNFEMIKGNVLKLISKKSNLPQLECIPQHKILKIPIKK